MNKKREIDVILRDLAKRRDGKITERLENIVDHSGDALFVSLLDRLLKALPQKHEVSGPEGGPIEVKWPGV